MKRRVFVLVTAFILLTAAVLYGTVFSSVDPVNNNDDSSLGGALEVISLVRSRFYKPVNTADLLQAYASTGTINGMLAEALEDPYTRYMDQHAYDNMMSQTSGVFGGIGIQIGIRDDKLTIIAPIKGTPGERAGLRSQDLIIKVEGKDTTYMTADEAATLMRGPENTEVTITIQRGEENFDVKIIRALINVASIEQAKMLEDSIGYIHMTNFSERTYKELTESLETLYAQGMQALVLDLRFNPGGTLQAALLSANEFISGGPIVHLEDREGQRTTYEATTGMNWPQLPIVVLINGSSASASEILSGALRDHELATLVGTTTFGKGLVQAVIPLRDGGAISLTEQVYLTAGGHDINQVGILPDIEIEISDEEELAIYNEEPGHVDQQLIKALEIIRTELE